jgi:hypothetical protein
MLSMLFYAGPKTVTSSRIYRRKKEAKLTLY